MMVDNGTDPLLVFLDPLMGFGLRRFSPVPRRLVVLVLGALVLVAASGSFAFAADGYAPVTGDLTVDKTNPAPGSDVTVSGDCKAPGLLLSITIVPPGTVLGTVTTGADGKFSLRVTIPANADGAAKLVASDAAGTCVLVAAITVNKGALAFTGSDSTNTFLALGAVLVAMGAVLVVITIRRRRAPTSA